MRLNYLSNKGSSAPIIYMLIQITLLCGLVLTCPSLINATSYGYFILFWLIVATTIAMFFFVHRTDPGYVPYDGVFFTDQEEPPLSASNHHKYDSMMKLKAADSRIFPGFDLSPSAMESQMRQNMFLANKSPKDKSIFMKMTLSSTAMSKNLRDTLSSPAPQKVGQEDEGMQRQGAVHEDEDNTRVDVSLSQENVTQRNNDLDFEITENMDEETKQTYIIPTIPQEGQIEEVPEIKRGNYCSAREESYKENIKKLTAITEIHPKQEVKEYHNEDDHSDPTIGERDSKEKGDHKEDLDCSIHQVQQNQGNSSKETNKDRRLEQEEPNNIVTLREIQGKRGKYYELKEDSIDNHGKEVIEHLDTIQQPSASHLTREKHYAQKTNNSEDKSGDKIESAKSDKDTAIVNKTEKQFETLYVERRYCTACNIDQPLRAKHCRDCNKCVAQYDHHCPWLGTCIGEKNHLPFYFFLILQLIEIVYGEAKLVEGVVENFENFEWLFVDIWRIIILLPTTFFFIMVGSLFAFHSYLATQNLTTCNKYSWEFLSWTKISYLKEWQSKWGSPFSQGIKKNVVFFFTFKKELKRWKMPKYKAPLDQQNAMAQ